MRAPVVAPLLATLLLAAAPALPRENPTPLAGASASVVVSIAISAGILPPSDFPIAGRDCDAVLAKLRRSERFAGQIHATYEPPVDAGRCFNLRGKKAQVAVVCCAPRSLR